MKNTSESGLAKTNEAIPICQTDWHRLAKRHVIFNSL
jgi:hypothetical protein